MRLFISKIIDFVKEHNAGALGAVFGFVIAILLVVFGFFETIFIVAMSVVGYFVGVSIFGDRDKVKNFLDKLLPPGRFR